MVSGLAGETLCELPATKKRGASRVVRHEGMTGTKIALTVCRIL